MPHNRITVPLHGVGWGRIGSDVMDRLTQTHRQFDRTKATVQETRSIYREKKMPYNTQQETLTNTSLTPTVDAVNSLVSGEQLLVAKSVLTSRGGLLLVSFPAGGATPRDRSDAHRTRRNVAVGVEQY